MEKNFQNHIDKRIRELHERMRNNKLKKLPNIFPPSLMYLDVSDNKLEELPDLLPSNLRILRAWNNHNLRKSSYNYPGVFVFM